MFGDILSICLCLNDYKANLSSSSKGQICASDRCVRRSVRTHSTTNGCYVVSQNWTVATTDCWWTPVNNDMVGVDVRNMNFIRGL